MDTIPSCNVGFYLGESIDDILPIMGLTPNSLLLQSFRPQVKLNEPFVESYSGFI